MLVAGAVALVAKDVPAVPAAFLQPGGWQALPAGTRVAGETVALGGVIAEQRVAYPRTGVLKSELVSGGMLNRYRFPAGTPVYAIDSAGLGTGWCAAGSYQPRGAGQAPRRLRERCLFWKDNAVVESVAFDTRSRFASASLTGITRVKGNLEIEERPLPYPQTFKLVATLGKAHEAARAIELWFDDGTDRTLLLRSRRPVQADGSFKLEIWGGELALMPDGSGGYRISTERPLSDVLAPAGALRGRRSFDHASNVTVVRY